ncbi:GPW/gp25 family protein [Oculatella sp. FACHB-28]|uniref:GPW/gp25 family protein n=1 Tax=Oculatella sp. FACHB-28 TaxID=2692845 RepID=UPI00168724E1|nr:GPW/gp25 family protein [Oculatella sp. FACHB-28]MBD2060519.1 GPW/gp25 family protein [Oculatella sp. FACHB-28]
MADITGIKYPLEIDERGGLVIASDEELIAGHIIQFLETEPLERVMRKDYGTPDFLFSSAQEVNSLAADINRRLTQYIPQASFRVEGSLTDLGELQIDIYWQYNSIAQQPITVVFNQ